jgi:hypothetical protein
MVGERHGRGMLCVNPPYGMGSPHVKKNKSSEVFPDWVTFFWQAAVVLRDLCVSSLIITEGAPGYWVTVAPDLLSSLLSSTLFSHTFVLCSSLFVRNEILLQAKLCVFYPLFCFVCQTGIGKILDSAAANMTRIQSVTFIYFVVDFSGYIADAT